MSTATRPVRVVVGPLTRLGRELVAGDGVDLRLVARDGADAAVLADRYRDRAGVAVVDAGDRGTALLGPGDSPIELVIAALGPVHPTPVRPDADREAFRRDRELIAAVFDAAGVRPVSVVLVSSVVALAPADDRRYYGGWKNLAEAELQALIAGRPGPTSLAVLFPGRLMDDVDRTRPWHRLHAGYGLLADRIERALTGAPVGRLVGADTRLWLLARALKTGLGVLRAPRAEIPASVLASHEPVAVVSTPPLPVPEHRTAS